MGEMLSSAGKKSTPSSKHKTSCFYRPGNQSELDVGLTVRQHPDRRLPAVTETIMAAATLFPANPAV